MQPADAGLPLREQASAQAEWGGACEPHLPCRRRTSSTAPPAGSAGPARPSPAGDARRQAIGRRGHRQAQTTKGLPGAACRPSNETILYACRPHTGPRSGAGARVLLREFLPPIYHIGLCCRSPTGRSPGTSTPMPSDQANVISFPERPARAASMTGRGRSSGRSRRNWPWPATAGCARSRSPRSRATAAPSRPDAPAITTTRRASPRPWRTSRATSPAPRRRPALERDDFSSSRHPALPLFLSMIFSKTGSHFSGSCLRTMAGAAAAGSGGSGRARPDPPRAGSARTPRR